MSKNYILVQNGVAWEVFQTRPVLHASLQIEEVDAGTVVAGDLWDQDNGTFSSPPPIVNPIVPGGTFLGRLTDDEYADIVAAAGSSVQLARYIELVRLNGFVDVSSGAAIAAKAVLIGANLLTSERADIVFANMD